MQQYAKKHNKNCDSLCVREQMDERREKWTALKFIFAVAFVEILWLLDFVCEWFNVCAASNEWVLLWIKLCKMLATISIMMMMIITKSLSILLLCVHGLLTLAWNACECAIVHGLKWSECLWRTLHTAFHPPHFLTNTHAPTCSRTLWHGSTIHTCGVVCANLVLDADVSYREIQLLDRIASSSSSYAA